MTMMMMMKRGGDDLVSSLGGDGGGDGDGDGGEDCDDYCGGVEDHQSSPKRTQDW